MHRDSLGFNRRGDRTCAALRHGGPQAIRRWLRASRDSSRRTTPRLAADLGWRADISTRRLSTRPERVSGRQKCARGHSPTRRPRLPGAGRRRRGRQRRPALPAKAAKVAKPASTGPRFSNFSNFSRGTSPNRDSWSPADWRAYFEERAAIREYEGGLARDQAERFAFEDTVSHWLSAHPAPATPPDQCVHCRHTQRTNDVLLPMLADGGHTWIHKGCWSEWYSARRREAVASLRAAGVRRLPTPTILLKWH